MSRATERAAAATSAWKTATRAQRSATVRHEDLYVLTGEVVDTVYALTDLVGVLAGQVAEYEWTARGEVYDDSRDDSRAGRRPVAPNTRLRTASRELDTVRRSLIQTSQIANNAWSTLSHIGVDLDPPRGGAR